MPRNVVIISLQQGQMFSVGEHICRRRNQFCTYSEIFVVGPSGRNGTGGPMEGNSKYFVLKKKAVPDVLLRVVEAKRLLDSGKAASVNDATQMVGISRSSFYKYKDDIFPFHDNAKGKTITMVIQLDDETGLLSDTLKIVAGYQANILTIHQSIPVNGVASLTLSVEVNEDTGDLSAMIEEIEKKEGIHYLKVLARE